MEGFEFKDARFKMQAEKFEIRKSIKARLIRIYRKGLIKKRTKAECVFRDILKRLGVDFIFQAGFLSTQSFYIVDFYIKSPYKLIIEIEDYNHRQRKRNIYIKQKFGFFRRSGFRVLKFSNENVLNQGLKVERQLRSCLIRLTREFFKGKTPSTTSSLPPSPRR